MREKNHLRGAVGLLICAAMLVLVGCGGPYWSKVCSPYDDTCDLASAGGTLSGLSSGEWAELVNDGFDTVVLTTNGPFTFPTQLTNFSNYAVTVKLESPGITCTVRNGTGLVGFNGVTNVIVSCTQAVSDASNTSRRRVSD